MGMVKTEVSLAALRALLRLPEDVEIVGAYMFSEKPTQAADAVTFILSGPSLPEVVKKHRHPNGAEIPDPDVVPLHTVQDKGKD
jgi:hypothetical protein